MLLDVAGRRSEAGPRAASLPSFCPRAIDASFTGAQQDEVHRLCGWLLDGDDGAPLQASKSPSSLQPALSTAAAPPCNQRSLPAAQPQTPFSVDAPNAGPAYVSPFGAAATPAFLFAAPQSASGGPASPPRTGDRALSWVAMWCARAEAEGMQCLPPPSSPSWQQLVTSGSLGGTLGQSSGSLSLPLPCRTSSPNTTRASSAPACCRRCGAAGERKAPAKRRRTDANHHDQVCTDVQHLH